MDEQLRLPKSFDFADLGLVRHSDSSLYISNLALLEEVLEFNGIPIRRFRNRPYYTYVAVFALRSCYEGHLERGGRPDMLMEELLGCA